MKRLLLVLLMCCLMVSLSTAGVEDDHAAGPEGVKFEQKSFADILAKAQKENKLVMLDAYTDT